jgi:protein involved in polysaccharide export with SLBB domain
MAGKPTLMESISLAGGLTEKSNVEKIRLVRAKAAKVGVEEIYDFEAIKAAKVADPVLENNDTVFVDESIPIIVEGSVVRPGVLYAKPQTTLMQVVSLAGGLRELADSSSIKVYGAESATGRTAQTYNLERIREGKEPDPKLTPGNVVVVEESTGKAIMYSVGRTVRQLFTFGGMRNPVGGP